VCYILVGLLLITVAGYGKWAAYVNQIEIIGGIIACGVFLLLISIVRHMCIVRYIFGMLNLNGDEFVIVGDGLYNSDNHPKKRYPFPPGHGAHLNCFEEMHHLYVGEAVLTDCLLC